MRVCFLGICVISVISISWINAEATIVNGGYNVLVTFSQNVPQEIGWQTVENMKASLQEASKILHDAIGFQFSKVTFEIPEFWDTSERNVTDETHSGKADIVIDNANDTVFGKFPFAQQYGSCGVPGHQIIVPTTFLLEEGVFPRGVSFAREWLKYRYGVFDENGYSGDPLYPSYYHIPGSNPNEVHITDCINSEITYDFLDKDGNDCSSDEMLINKLNSKECGLFVNEENSENVSSSLLYFQENVTRMTDICGKDDGHQHNSRSPNKQNALCYGESIWKIISQSSDFTKTEREEYKDIEFVYSKETKPRVVVAWENTQRLERYKDSKVIMNTITKLMIDLPSGSKFRAFPFTKEVPKEDYPLQDLSLDRIRSFASSFRSDFEETEDGNYKAAIEKAKTILKASAENPDEPPGNIIIIAGTADNLILILLKDLNICIQSVESLTLPDNVDELKSDLPCLEVVRIPMSEYLNTTYEKFIEAVERIGPTKVQDKLTETLKVQYLEDNKPLNVSVDSYTEIITFSAFTDKESVNFKLESNGKILKEKEELICGNVVRLSYSIKEPGTYNFSYRRPIQQPILVEVKKTSKSGRYFSGKVITHDTSGENDKDQMPVIIYAIVRFGPYPVQNAIVSARIKRPDGDDINLDLYDDGRGDPDITKNDGVYSRYFTNFSGEGDYTVTVSIKNNESETRYGEDKNAGYRSCCGSKANTDENLNLPQLNEFEKIFVTTFKAKSGRPAEGYKPSRITDLKIDSVTDDGIVLKWTAPGEEADSGKVLSYEIKIFNTTEDAKNNFENSGNLFVYTSSPKERGETEELKISYDAFEKNGLYYIAMKAKNSNKESDLSPIVEFYISNKATTDSPNQEKEEDGKLKTGKTNPKTIGLIVGLIVGLLLLLILIYVVIYLVIVKPKRKRQQKENTVNESPKTESNVLNPINYISADTHIKHHSEKVKAKSENKNPPIFKEEDFENKNFRPTSASSTGKNDQEQEIYHKNLQNGQFPPKSPRRITPV